MPQVDFALIGHPESWNSASAVISVLRGADRPPLAMREVREIIPWIPPRIASRVTVGSSRGRQVRGVYIDCFIPPDQLDGSFRKENLARVRAAAARAIKEGARVVTLGGFSSILLEGKTDLLPSHSETAFTTGNTLTVALIVKGIERALTLTGQELSKSSVLIVGASGDVGSGCARCLAPRIKRLFLFARNQDRLRRFASTFLPLGSRVTAGTDLQELSQRADAVICAASMTAPELLLEALPPDSIVCDAGYPKNVSPEFASRHKTIFYGGFGQASGGITLDPDLLGVIYPYSVHNVAHGCLLEGVVLAMEERFEPFSQGRGRITPQRVEEIWQTAGKHGIGLPPLFNGSGPMEEDMRCLEREVPL